MIRDPESAILVALLRGPKRGLTVAEIRSVTNAGTTTIGNNLANMASDRSWALRPEPWVVRVEGTRPHRWQLTDRGREVARWRARTSQFRLPKAQP